MLTQKNGEFNEDERILLGERLEDIGYKIILTQSIKDYFYTLSLDLIDFIFKNKLEEVILISVDVDLGETIVMLKNASNINVRWEIWKFEDSFDPCFLQMLMDEGIKLRNLDYAIFSSLLNS